MSDQKRPRVPSPRRMGRGDQRTSVEPSNPPPDQTRVPPLAAARSNSPGHGAHVPRPASDHSHPSPQTTAHLRNRIVIDRLRRSTQAAHAHSLATFTNDLGSRGSRGSRLSAHSLHSLPPGRSGAYHSLTPGPTRLQTAIGHSLASQRSGGFGHSLSQSMIAPPRHHTGSGTPSGVSGSHAPSIGTHSMTGTSGRASGRGTPSLKLQHSIGSLYEGSPNAFLVGRGHSKAVNPDWGFVNKLLMENSTSKYDIEYDEHPNHLMQTLVSMQRLGAHTLQLENFFVEYVKRLDPAKPAVKITIDEVEELVGRKENFSGIRDCMQWEIEKEVGDVGEDKQFLKEQLEIPNVVHVNCCFHPIIHLGWALHIEDEATQNHHIAEGLAYMIAYAYPLYKFEEVMWPESGLDRPRSESSVPWDDCQRCAKKQKHGGADLLQCALHPFRDDPDYIHSMKTVADSADSIFMEDWHSSNFQRRVAVLLHHPDFYPKIVAQAQIILNDLPVTKGPDIFGRSLCIMALRLYTLSEVRNGFFLVHCFQAAYAFWKVATYIDAESDVLEIAAKVFVEGIVATYFFFVQLFSRLRLSFYLFLRYCAMETSTPTIRSPPSPPPVIKKTEGLPDFLVLAIKTVISGKSGGRPYDPHKYMILDVLKEMWTWQEVQSEDELRGLVKQASSDIFAPCPILDP